MLQSPVHIGRCSLLKTCRCYFRQLIRSLQFVNSSFTEKVYGLKKKEFPRLISHQRLYNSKNKALQYAYTTSISRVTFLLYSMTRILMRQTFTIITWLTTSTSTLRALWAKPTMLLSTTLSRWVTGTTSAWPNGEVASSHMLWRMSAPPTK